LGGPPEALEDFALLIQATPSDGDEGLELLGFYEVS